MHLALPNPERPNPDLVIATTDQRGNVPRPTPATDSMGFEHGITVQSRAHEDWTSFCNYLNSWTAWWGSSIQDAQHSKSIASISALETTAGSGEDPSSAWILSRPTDTGHANGSAGRGDFAVSAALEDRSDSLNSATGSPQADSQRGTDPQASQPGSNDWQANIEGSELGITSPRSKNDAQIASTPTYHVTCLSTLMANTLTVSLSTVVADILLLPLEALFVRSVTLAYLDTASGASYAAMGLRNEIYPLGSWFGLGLRGGSALEYARKMALCFGVNMLLRFGVWQLNAGATWWIGRKYYRWGKL
ncbi:MAG: hypothetical protein Q9224_003849 [Gallowayella concinna]